MVKVYSVAHSLAANNGVFKRSSSTLHCSIIFCLHGSIEDCGRTGLMKQQIHRRGMDFGGTCLTSADLMYQCYLEEVPNIQGTLNVILFCIDHLVPCQYPRLLQALRCHSRGRLIHYKAYVLYKHGTRSL